MTDGVAQIQAKRVHDGDGTQVFKTDRIVVGEHAVVEIEGLRIGIPPDASSADVQGALEFVGFTVTGPKGGPFTITAYHKATKGEPPVRLEP